MESNTLRVEACWESDSNQVSDMTLLTNRGCQVRVSIMSCWHPVQQGVSGTRPQSDNCVYFGSIADIKFWVFLISIMSRVCWDYV